MNTHLHRLVVKNVSVHGPSKAQTTRYAVIDHSTNKACGYTLFLFGKRGRHENVCGRVAQIHRPGHDEHGDEGLGPVCLMKWHGGEEEGAEHKEGHRDEHDVAHSDALYEPDGREGEEYAGDGYRRRFGSCEKRRMSP